MDYGRLLLTGLICNVDIASAGTGLGAGPYTTVTALTPAQVASNAAVTATAANQALVAQ